MIKDRAKYENINDKSPLITESIYKNSVFLDHDEDTTKSPLLNNSLSSNNIEQSPYEEVAVNISNTDDPTILCLTVRSIFIGILLTCVMAFLSQFFALRTSPLDLNNGIIILLAYMIGKLMSIILPERVCHITLNPGPFTFKEHTLITIMAASGTRTYEGIETLMIQRLYYKYHLNHFNSVLFLIIMHFIAISISGILHRYLIWPSFMLWPKTLMSCSLIRTLINEDEFNKDNTRWKMSRLKFFWLIVLFQFLWYWFPGYIFPLLSFFSLICFMAPKNIILSQITGAYGLGLGAIEFDWNALVAYLDSPILVPFWAHVNIFAGFIAVVWIVTPIIYYLNIWDSKKMPIISYRVFDKDGYFYNTTKILTEDFHINKTAYEIYGPVHITAGYVISCGFTFAGMSALIVHTIFYHGKSIVEQFRSNLSNKNNDIHAKLMSHYPEVAEWWYYIMLLLSFLIALLLCYFTEIMPASLLPVSLLLTIIFALPTGIITAITNMTMTAIVASDVISSLIVLGNPIAYLTFRTFAYTCQNQVLIYLMNSKIGHYMKIPPRIVFPLFILASIITSIIQYITAIYLLNHLPHICTSKNPVWRCLSLQSTHTSSIIFGVTGSFIWSSQYSSMLYGFLIGTILPILSWLLWKIFPHIKWLALINFPIFLMATTNFPPAPAAEFPSWFLIGFIFNFILYRYAHNWWEKYAYIFSIAMSCGVAICSFIIFLAFQLNHTDFPQWWGLGGINRDGCPLDSANFSGFIPTERYI
ncbi:unnamed protein product [Rotaria sordida]|uniref:Oligopeptide transporter n=1 Tax=Rotaria sordida TaxID=392033 RepID=A0A818LKS3_9BILA|nr:unnamed protein product [Rotaria sordida]